MTENCIDCIEEKTKSTYEIIVVDNGSTDIVSDEYKAKIKYIRSNTNLNFAGGCNLGAKNAKYENLCFLNNDTMPMDNWENSYNLLNDEIGIVGSKLLYPSGLIQHAGIEYIPTRPYEPISMEHRFKNLSDDLPESNLYAICPSVTGACLFIKKVDFDKLNGFDENYTNWLEDNDLCYRVRFDFNKKIL